MPETDKLRKTGLIKATVFMMLGLLGLATSHSWAEPEPGVLTLLYQRAKQHDAVYRSSVSAALARQQTLNQGRAALLPQLEASALWQQVDAERSAFGQSASSTSNPFGYTVTLNQPLFRMQSWENFKQAELVFGLSKMQARQAEQDLILRVAQAYFDALAAKDNLQTILAQKEATRVQLKVAQKNFELGNASITDQQEAQARFDLIQANELAAQNQVNVTELNLLAIVGPAPVPWLSPSRELKLSPPEPNQIKPWLEQAGSSNLGLQQARINTEIATREVRKQRYGHLPTLDLQTQYLNGEQTLFDNTTGQPFDAREKSTTVGVLLSLPLFSGGLTTSQVDQAAHLLNKAHADQEQAAKTASLQTQSAFLNVQTGLSRIQALKTAVQSSELALQANQTGYEVGVRINLDVLDAQQQVSGAKRQLLQAQYDTLVSLLQLDAASGQLSEKRLKQLDALLTERASQ